MVARIARADAFSQGIVVLLAIEVAQLGLARVIGAGESAGHAMIHAIAALAFLAIAGLLLWRRPDAGTVVRAPAVGLAALSIALLVESFGAYGFEADNDTRNGFAVVHDLGSGLTSLGLVAAVAGLGVGLAALSLGRRGVARGATLAAAVVVVVVGILGVKTLIGL